MADTTPKESARLAAAKNTLKGFIVRAQAFLSIVNPDPFEIRKWHNEATLAVRYAFGANASSAFHNLSSGPMPDDPKAFVREHLSALRTIHDQAIETDVSLTFTPAQRRYREDAE